MAEWIHPEHSKGQVRRSGDILRKSDHPFDETEAISVLNNWKAAHELPLHYIVKKIQQYADDVSDENTLVQRRKRTESILLKLEQQPKLDLARMQDLVGCRVVFRHEDSQKNLTCIENLIEKINMSSMESPLVRLTNYINEPRDTGYRSVHAIFKYKSDDYPRHKNMQVELQIRTKMQHIWATTVETVGMFEQSNLKQGIGDENWLEFFRQMSYIMAIDEGTIEVSTEKRKSLCKELSNAEKKVRAGITLSGYAIAQKVLHNALEQIDDDNEMLELVSYILMKLDLGPVVENKEPSIDIETFTSEELGDATEQYGIWENDAHDKKMCYVLLAKSQGANELRSGFPNYFADVHEFLRLLNRYISEKQ